MNNQQIFDTVATHLLRQGEPAIDQANDCFYRLNGLQCAIGCLIPDDIYNTDMEHQGVRDLIMGWPEIDALFDHEDDEETLLGDLQEIHDYNASPADWPKQLLTIAVEYGLDHSVLAA